ncbi:unnamed protein product [Gongylonema pulchrum]|uniref:Uncharacterized protein n=1 Tax=Gongylonema pulchrum TaxID=637853 RepID=A0A3P6R2P2_9BILA|nr:unnamed protein product [Gongylonema pulchrum]
MALVLFFVDELIEWYEAMSMFLIYIIYGITMKYNDHIEKIFRLKLYNITQFIGAEHRIPIATKYYGTSEVDSDAAFRGALSKQCYSIAAKGF